MFFLSFIFISDFFDSSYIMYNFFKYLIVNFFARGFFLLRGLSKKRVIKDELSY